MDEQIKYACFSVQSLYTLIHTRPHWWCAHCCYVLHTTQFKIERQTAMVVVVVVKEATMVRMFVCEYALNKTADDFRLRASWQKSTLNNADYVRKTVEWMPKARLLPLAPKFPSWYIKTWSEFLWLFVCVCEPNLAVCWFFFTIHSNNRTLTAYSLYQTFSVTPLFFTGITYYTKAFRKWSLYVLSVDLIPLFSYEIFVCMVSVYRQAMLHKALIRLFTRSLAFFIQCPSFFLCLVYFPP